MENNLLGKTLRYVRVFLHSSMLQLLLTSVLFAQGVNITGRVTSAEDAEGLPGANVVEQGTTNGAAKILRKGLLKTVSVKTGTVLFLDPLH